ncbi:hypothetical protein BGW39_011090 [Mortierella sp. 14UC]|nr:hypothetical protein BGW39_011090 [Mortierella sp. 14UC]
MSLALKINPIEIPELLHIIASHLSTRDHKSCLLVSKTWHHLFQTHSWNHLIHSRQGNPFLEKYGHLVRVVSTYGICDKDMYVIARNCALVRRVELLLNGTATWRGLEYLVATVGGGIRELVLTTSYCTPRLLLCIAQLKRLQVLELSVDPYRSQECNLKMLLAVLSECRSLVSLKISRLVDNTITLPTKIKPPLPPSARVDAIVAMAQPDPSSPTPPASRSLLARIGRTLGLGPTPESTQVRSTPRQVPFSLSTVRPDRPSAELQGKEPWRKFVVYPPPSPEEVDANDPNLFTEAEDLLLRRSTMALDPFPHLRRIHLSNISTPTITIFDKTTTGLEILFRKSPCLEDLSLHCSNILPKHLSACLDAITDTCHLIQTLELIGLCPISQNNSELCRFFQQHRPDLRILKLQNCRGLEFAINLIPPATLAGLERVSFEYTLFSHPILHKFMTQAKSLQYFTWKTEAPPRHPPLPRQPTPPPPLPENQRISAFLEPWACYRTMRHIEQNHAIVDQDSFEAYYQQRLTQMERLVSLGVSIPDIRRSMVLSKGEGTVEGLDAEEVQQLGLQGWSSAVRGLYMDISGGEASRDVPHSHYAQPSIYTNCNQATQQSRSSPTESLQEVEHEKHHHWQGEQAERRGGWYFPTIQELVIGMIGINAINYLLDTRQLTRHEIEYLLVSFPSLRKIRYQGRIYPLDHEARKFLEELEGRRILVVHVAQSAPVM